MPKFFNNDLADLTHQLELSPRRLRTEQLRGIERLLALVEPQKAYPYDFICFHITKFRKTDSLNGFSVPGKALISDLVTMAETLSRRAGISVAELGEPLETHQELAERLQVSTKTVRRWRNRGLLGLRLVFADGVNRLAFCRGVVDRFVERNAALVAKGASFRQLTKSERDKIVARAREIVSNRRLKLHSVAKMIAEETGRAVETVRYTLRRYDESIGAVPVFRKNVEAFDCERSAVIWRCHEAGDRVQDIATAVGCATAEVEQTLRSVQVQKWLQTPLDCVYHVLFDAPDADAVILEAPEPTASNGPLPKIPKDLPAYLRSLYATPLLSAEQERDLFRRYNYLKFKASKMLKGLRVDSVSAKAVETIRGLMAGIETLRQRLVRANLRLVVSIAKKHVGWSERFYEVVSDGNMSLMRAVEKFDYSMGNKFSTYASWAIIKNYARSIPEDHYYSKRFVTGQEELLDAVPDLSAVMGGESDRQQVGQLLLEGLRSLPDREREVLTNHFGLENKGVGLTLEQIGLKFGVTKERVRQIEQQALAHLRSILGPSLADALS